MMCIRGIYWQVYYTLNNNPGRIVEMLELRVFHGKLSVQKPHLDFVYKVNGFI